GDVTAEPDRRPVDGRDQRYLEPEQCLNDPVHVSAIALAYGRGRAAEGARAVLHGLDVAARRKGFAGAGEDGATDALIGVDLGARRRDLLAVAGLAERVHGLRAIQREHRDKTSFLELDHESLLLWCAMPLGLGWGRAYPDRSVSTHAFDYCWIQECMVCR